MGEDPEAIRRDIERTREEMSETIGAIGYKADVPARTKDRVSDTMDSAKEKVSDTMDTVKEKTGFAGGSAGDAASRVSDATPSREDVKQGAKRAAGLAQENPLGLAVGSLAIGFVAGLLIPSTRAEHEKLGPMADQVKEQAKQTGQEVVDRGKQVAQETAQTAKQTAQESAQGHGEELKQSAQENSQAAAQGVREQRGSAQR